MRKHFITHVVLLLIILGIVSYMPVYAQPSVSAQAAIVTEISSGRVLFSKNSDVQLPMASTTKIMTALVATEAAGDRLDEVIEISASAAGVEGSSMYLEQGEKMTLRELLYGLMLSSGNDAAVAIAEHIGGSVSDFVALMNEKATELGLTNTRFANPNGLPDESHYSSAHDMAKMTEYAIKNPDFAEIVKTKSYSISGEGKAYPRTLTNHNRLLRMYDGCIGVKTGFTKAAGRCLVSCAERDGMTLVCVTLNAPSDWNDHSAMLDFGFENYNMVQLTDTETPLCTAEIDGSYNVPIPVYASREIFFPLSEGETLIPEIQLFPHLSAPIEQGECVGKISFLPSGNIKLSADAIAGAEAPLIIRSDAQSPSIVSGFGKKLADNLHTIFSKWLKLL